MIKVMGGALVLLVAGLVTEVLKTMFMREVETRLHRLPYRILRIARRRLPAWHREQVHDHEWLPELDHIVRETEGLPLTRIVRGVRYAVGLLASARSISRALEGARAGDGRHPAPPGNTYPARAMSGSVVSATAGALWAQTHLDESLLSQAFYLGVATVCALVLLANVFVLLERHRRAGADHEPEADSPH